MNELADERPESFGRYLLYPAIARGGMATVHTARLVGVEGFTRLVAAKRLHPQFTDDPDFVTMFHDEACIASRIHHPNVVPVLDVVVSGSELILVQEYVHGVPLSQLMKVAQLSEVPIDVDVAVALMAGVLAGLHAAHEVKDEAGASLEIVHRDVSPANVMISVDGAPRLLDFGIAKATTSTHHTREGVFKGKLAYMAPEQLRMERVDRHADIYAAGVLAWELLVNRRVYDGRHEVSFVTAVMNGEIPTVTMSLTDQRSSIDDARWAALVALEPVISRAMSDRPEDRFATAEEMLRATLDAHPAATSIAVSEWVRMAGAEFLDKRQKVLAANEESWRRTSLFTPSSGTQRVTALASTSGIVAATALPGPQESVVCLEALQAAPLAAVAHSMRRSRLLPWVAAFGFTAAGLLGGLLHGSIEPSAAPRPVAAGAAAPPSEASQGPSSLTSVPVIAASQVTSAQPPATSPSVTGGVPVTAFWRSAHVTSPQPSPVRQPMPIRAPSNPPASATVVPNTNTAATGRSDCNPPFFFEGTKKIFKPSCL